MAFVGDSPAEHKVGRQLGLNRAVRPVAAVNSSTFDDGPEEAVRRAKELGLVDPNDLVVLLSSEPGNRVITRSINMSVAKVK